MTTLSGLPECPLEYSQNRCDYRLKCALVPSTLLFEDCQNKMLAADWKPAYEVERRTPAFIVDEHQRDGFDRLSMGMSL